MKRLKKVTGIILVVTLLLVNSQSLVIYANEKSIERNIKIKDDNIEVEFKEEKEGNKFKNVVDITPPELKLETLKIDKKEAKVGDTINISIKASDDISGIEYIWIYYRMPITGKSEWVQLYYNESANRYEGSIYIDENKESGLWEINWIYAKDNLENELTIYNSNINSYYVDIKEDLSAGNFKVNGTQPDVTPPTIDISSLKVDKREVKLGDSVNISIKATDDMSGTKYIWIYYRMPITGKSEWVQLYYNGSTNRYEGSIYIDENKESGLWEISWISAYDNLENELTIYNSNIHSYENIKEDLSTGNFNVETDDSTIKPVDGVTVVTQNEYWSNKTINGDLYIGPEAVLTISNYVSVTGNVYVLGALKINGGVTINGTLYGTSMSWGGNPILYNGTIVMNGSNSIGSMNMSNYPVQDIPIRIDNEPLVAIDGILNIKGATVNVADMHIEGEKVDLYYKGIFDIKGVNIGKKDEVTIEFKTVFGNTIIKTYNVINDQEEEVINVSNVTLNKSELSLAVGTSEILVPTVNPSNATNKELEWTSSDTKVATVDGNGKVTVVGAGSATITATAKDGSGKTATCKITVTNPIIKVTGISLNNSSLNLETGKTSILVATVSPSNASNKEVEWTSSDTKVATVDANGKVTAISAGTATITAKTKDGNKVATCKIIIKSQTDELDNGVIYQTHIEDYGWQEWKSNGEMSGTSGESKRLEGIRIKIDDIIPGASIKYRTHVQDYGWQEWKSNGEMSGTSGEAKRLEGIEIKLENAPGYSIEYRTHVQDYGWQEWKSNGEMSGTSGESKRLEGIEIRIVKDLEIEYRTHVQDYGWQEWKRNGEMSGTSGESKRLEGIEIKAENLPEGASIKYRTHVQDYGWQEWKRNGEMSGTSGEAKRLEGIEIKLENAPEYSIEYRTHIQDYGWQEWKSNGEMSGTSGESKRLEGIEVRVIKK